MGRHLERDSKEDRGKAEAPKRRWQAYRGSLLLTKLTSRFAANRPGGEPNLQVKGRCEGGGWVRNEQARGFDL